MHFKVGPKVDKSTLRKEVRDFCGNFAIYRMVPFSPQEVESGKVQVINMNYAKNCSGTGI